MTTITDNLTAVRARIERAARSAGRAAEGIRLVAVSKQQPVSAILQAVAAGQRNFGENYLQEAEPKLAELGTEDLTWHFIGTLQSNKTRPVAEHFDWVHTLDRYKIARRLSEHRPHHATPLQVCIQVKLVEEPRKGGVALAELASLAEQVVQLPGLRLRGLMCIPPEEEDAAASRAHFHRLRETLEQLGERGFELDTLSMGMSGDLEAAIAEGATIVRIGTAIFGPRAAAAPRTA